MKKILFTIVYFYISIIICSATDIKIDSIRINRSPVIDTTITSDTIVLGENDDLYIFLSNIEEGVDFLFKSMSDTLAESVIINNLLAYSNIPSGIYSLLAIQEGTLNDSTILLSIDVQENTVPTESVMSNWWFIPLLVFYLLLLFGGARYFIVLSGFRNKEKLIELRNDWTNRLHHDIGGDLSSVSLRLNNLQKQLDQMNPNVKESVIKTYNILKDIQKKLRFVFNLVDPKKDSLHVVLDEVRAFAQENFDLKGIKLIYKNDLDSNQSYDIDIGRVNKLHGAMKEVVNNCAKYSKAKAACITIKPGKRGLDIRIEDDGIGF
ncbi:MAG: hypothetical protein AAFO82_11405, partial [Bacteroidota bacterium]